MIKEKVYGIGYLDKNGIFQIYQKMPSPVIIQIPAHFPGRNISQHIFQVETYRNRKSEVNYALNSLGW